MRTADLARLVALAAIWGASFVFLRVLAPVLGAAWTAESRVLIAGLALTAWFRLTGFAPGWRRNAKVFVVIGLLNSALPFVLYGWAAQHLPAAVMAVVNACTPLSGAVCAAIWLGEPLMNVTRRCERSRGSSSARRRALAPATATLSSAFWRKVAIRSLSVSNSVRR